MNRKERRAAQKQGSGGGPSPQEPGPSAGAKLFAAAVQHFRAGELQQAERIARELLMIDRNNADALHLLGMIAFQLGRLDAARQLLDNALALNNRDANCIVNMAQVQRALGRLDNAVTYLVQAISINRDHTVARVALGDVLMQQGKLDDARARYERAAALDPNLAGAHYGLGNVSIQQGRLDDAVAHYRRVLALNPDYAEACSNLGVALAAQGKLDEAAAQYHRAIALRPGLMDVYRNLIRLLITQGDSVQGLAIARRALAIQETDEIKALLVQCVRNLDPASLPSGLRDLIARALSEGWMRPSELSALAADMIRLNKPLNDCIARAVKAWPQRLPARELWGEDGLAAVAGDRLLRALLEAAPVRDIELERFLTAVRSALLDMVVTAASPPAIDVLGLSCALARQCFINEYVFATTEDELRHVQSLQLAINEALESGTAVYALRLVVVAAYRSLYSLAMAEQILRRPWPNAMGALIDQQLREPSEELEIRSSIPSLTSIDNEVSRRVRRQYEEMPYPRWVRSGSVGKPVQIEWYLRNQFPRAPIQDAGRRGALDVLIAGCGTGQHAIETAQRFLGARVLAIDLSLTSLSYAARMTRMLDLSNIRYAQADILKLRTLDHSFDVIEAVGVLHHLGDWAEGWRTLLPLLRTGGFMHVGLYSAFARDDIRAARAFIAQRRFGDSGDDIRSLRQELLAQEDGSPLKNVTKYADFFATSECRDLLFHAQEHQLMLPDIKAFLADNQLAFIGFTGPVVQAFRKSVPDDKALGDLDQWHMFERENPLTFVGMYQFWIQKPVP